MQTPAAQLDRRIQLQAPTLTQDPSYGSSQTSWATTATVWARLLERQVAEAVETDTRVMTRSITLRIRHRTDVLSTWRVALGSRTLQITGVLEVGRREFLDLMCEEYSGA